MTPLKNVLVTDTWENKTDIMHFAKETNIDVDNATLENIMKLFILVSS